MAEEKKINPSFMRASEKPVRVEQDLGPMDMPEEEQKVTFVRASEKPVKVEDSLTDEEINELLAEQEKLKAEFETAKAELVSEKEELEELEEAGNSWENDEPVKVEVEEKKVEKDPKLSQVLTMLSKREAEKLEEETVEEEIKQEEVKVVETKKDDEDFKPEVKKPKVVDISKLTVVSKSEIDKERDLRQALFNNKAAFQIVAAQSGYMAKVAPLVHKDIVNMLYGNLGRYEYKKAVYKTIHDKVFDTSVGKLSFEDWLKYTSVEDMETFYYGVYSSTFPNEGSFRFTCPVCGEEHDYKVNHNNLIKTTDRDHMRKRIEDITANATSVEKMKEFSLVGEGEAVMLSQSKLIIELKTPSLLDSLEILRTVPEKTIDKDAISVTNMLYINKILIPSKDSEGTYIEESGKTGILRIIDNLPIDDANELQVAVFDRVDSNRITYSIKNIKCVKCGHEEKDIPISIEDILFTLIFEKTQ